MRDLRGGRRSGRARAPNVNDELRRRRQQHRDEDHQDREANDARLRRLVGRRMQNHEREQERKQNDEGWAQPPVSFPALEQLPQPNHGRRW